MCVINISLIIVIFLLLYIIFSSRGNIENFTVSNKLNISYVDQNGNRFYLTTQNVANCNNIQAILNNPKNPCMSPKNECGIAVPILSPKNTHHAESQIFHTQKTSATGSTMILSSRINRQPLFLSQVLNQLKVNPRPQLCFIDRISANSTVCMLVPNGSKYNIVFGNSYVAICNPGTDSRCQVNGFCNQEMNHGETTSEAEVISSVSAEGTKYFLQYKRLCLTTNKAQALLFDVNVVG